MIDSGDGVAISKLMNRLGREVKLIIENALQLSYYSRGAWPYHTVLNMTQAEREMAADFINERLTIASKSHHPVY